MPIPERADSDEWAGGGSPPPPRRDSGSGSATLPVALAAAAAVQQPRGARRAAGGDGAANGAAAADPAPGGAAGAADAAQGRAPAPHFDDAAALLTASMDDMPQPLDSERLRPYSPPNPFKTPPYYPQEPHQVFRQPELFHRLTLDTLFFAFYYQQATYQQYLASRALKSKSWRYHSQHCVWLQRAKPPRVTGADYEEGTYNYFDYMDGWCKRAREFTFEYKFLENEIPPLPAPPGGGS